jgi:hypothetical protein
MFARDLQGLNSDLHPLRFIKRQIAVLLIILGEDQRNEKQIERAVGDFPQLRQRKRRHLIARQDLVGDGKNSLDVGFDCIGHGPNQESIH